MTRTEVVAQLTGPGSLNRTEIWDVHGTDLGHLFNHRGRLYMVFGDTFGPQRRGWRSNVAALISNPVVLPEGLRFADMICDGRGRAYELLGSRKQPGAETTVIPTYGVSTGEEMVLHWMSVRSFDEPGNWRTNDSGLAVSADGEDWRVLDAPRWPADSSFAQVCFVPAGEEIFVFGIPAGRFGPVCLARVRTDELTDGHRWHYWDGAGWVTGDERAARPVVPAPAGELSVHYSDHHGCWLFMTLNEEREAIVLRTATDLTGPWSDEQVITTAAEYPQLYAPYLVPLPVDGPDIYFTMSRFDTYNVYLLRTRL